MSQFILLCPFCFCRGLSLCHLFLDCYRFISGSPFLYFCLISQKVDCKVDVFYFFVYLLALEFSFCFFLLVCFFLPIFLLCSLLLIAIYCCLFLFCTIFLLLYLVFVWLLSMYKLKWIICMFSESFFYFANSEFFLAQIKVISWVLATLVYILVIIWYPFSYQIQC